MKIKINRATLSRVCIGLILFVVIIIPIVRMLLYIKVESFEKIFTSGEFYTALLNSLASTIAATICSVVIAYLLALCLKRTSIKFKGIFNIVLILPMLIPSISHGMGLIVLFGNNGLLTNFLGIKSSIYGFTGILLGSILYSFPVAFLMFTDVLNYEDNTQHEMAKVLGFSKIRHFTAISFPYLKKPLISIIFATFTMIITDYGVPLSVGGQFKTLPVMLYENAAGQLDYSSGSVIGLVLLIPAIAAFLIDFLNKDKGNSTYVATRYIENKNTVRDVVSYIFCTLVSMFVLMVIVSFCVQAFARSYPFDMSVTFDNIQKTFQKNGGKYLVNSIIIAFLTAIIGTGIAFLTAYLSARMKNRTSRFLHLMAITSMAVPGLVLGLSYVILFKGSFIYGTIVILIMVNMVHFFASPYLMMYNAMNKMNENLEDVGHILGINRMHMIKDVVIPLSKGTLLEMFSYFFVNSMMTISAVAFLSTSQNKPLALLINQFETYNMMECAAVVALMILTVNIMIKVVIYGIKKIGEKQNVNKKAI
ncbi:ABC transporter permease subunit [Acholeplasma sp. OttesenSCG-928-E16]|nr:ABC transporter permease subunit [Acholeplasma sp. OttesenSCG-928-E16]